MLNKIALFVGNNITAHLIINQIIPGMLANSIEPILFMTDYSSSPKALLPALQNYAFYEGTIASEVIYPFIESNGFARDGKNGPVKNLNYSPKQLSEFYNFPIKKVSNVNDPEFITQLQLEKNIIGALSIRNYQIFKPEIIEFFEKKGFFWNLHMGVLPAYRGVYIPLRAIANKEKEYGWTLHVVDAGIDTGPIIDICALPLNPAKSIFETYLELVPLGSEMILHHVNNWMLNKKIDFHTQSVSEGSYYSFPTAQELATWENQGIHLVNPLVMAKTYVEKYAPPETVYSHRLRDTVIQAIAEWERSKQTVEKFIPMRVQKRA